MSRLSKRVIRIPDGVSISYQSGDVLVKGPLGSLSLSFCPGFFLEISDQDCLVKFNFEEITEYRRREVRARSLQGLYKSLLSNMVKGVSIGFEKKVILSGVGFKAQLQDKNLTLSVGFSHPVKYNLPKLVDCVLGKNSTELTLKSVDKIILGETVAQICRFRPVEPYKGKGIKVEGQIVKSKFGKVSKK